MQRTVVALQRTCGAVDMTGVALMRIGGSRDRAGVALERSRPELEVKTPHPRGPAGPRPPRPADFLR